MEFALGRSSHGGGVKEEKRSESSGGGDDEAHRKEEIDVEVPPMVETGPKASSTKTDEEAEELESAQAEMGEVIQENQRLKQYLDRVLKDYRTLQMQFHDVVQKETKESADKKHDHNHQELITEESDELVSLSLGRVSSNPRNYEKSKVFKPILKDEQYKENLALGLDCKFETSKSGSTIEALPDPSPANSSEVPKDEAGETWPPSKVLKTTRDNGGEDEVSQQNPAKKARVCVRARCEAPTMNDGCQWRKYGQKIAKGNPCPRAYYRCTVAPSCPVRKQVQRYAPDTSILITTYEGIHNHPLPLSATAMASTTSAAASMLLSGSISSSSRPGSTATPTTSPDLHGLNFYLSADGSKSKQFYLSNPALSSSPSHPTITLDLTTNPASSSSHFGRFTSNYNPPRYPSSTSLNFNSSQPTNAIPWSNDFLSHNNRTINLGRSTMENIYQLPYMQKNNNPTPPAHHTLPDTIAAATKAITADPTFQSALAAALSSIIGNGSSGIGSIQGNHRGLGENLAHKIMKWGEVFPAASSSLPSSTSKLNGCASSLMNKTPTNAVQAGSLMFLPPSLPFSSSKSASASPGDNRDNAN